MVTQISTSVTTVTTTDEGSMKLLLMAVIQKVADKS